METDERPLQAVWMLTGSPAAPRRAKSLGCLVHCGRLWEPWATGDFARGAGTSRTCPVGSCVLGGEVRVEDWRGLGLGKRPGSDG